MESRPSFIFVLELKNVKDSLGQWGGRERQKIQVMPFDKSFLKRSPWWTIQNRTTTYQEGGWCVNHSSDSTARGKYQDCQHGTQKIAVHDSLASNHPFPPGSTSHQKPAHTIKQTSQTNGFMCMYERTHVCVISLAWTNMLQNCIAIVGMDNNTKHSIKVTYVSGTVLIKCFSCINSVLIFLTT